MDGGCVAFQSGCDLLHIENHITASFEERYDSLDAIHWWCIFCVCFFLGFPCISFMQTFNIISLRSGAADKQTHQLEQKSEQISKSHKVVVKCLMLLFISQPALMSLDFCQCHNIHR